MESFLGCGVKGCDFPLSVTQIEGFLMQFFLFPFSYISSLVV